MSTVEIPAPQRRRKRLWLVAAGALALVVAATVIAVIANGTEPEDVVQDYLEVLHRRDAEAALTYTDQLDGFQEGSHEFLLPQAMAEDWTVTRLVRRHAEDDDPANVDVTITAADGTAREGRFSLIENADGDWRIVNPLVKLSVEQLPADFVELNGVTSTAEEFWLFPGSYRVFPSLAGVVTAPTYVAVPPSGDGRADGTGEGIRTEGYLPLFGAGPDQAALFQQQLNAWIDACATSKAPNPQGCPFAAAYSDHSEVALDDGSEYRVTEVTWKVESYPEVRVRQGHQTFTLITVVPGYMRVSGEGRPYHPEDAPAEKFSGRCGLQLNGVNVSLAPGGFAFSFPTTFSSTCVLPYG